ncbi:MAG TPA: DNA translocase FtsK 4TM domain-containing protein [bacterium]|nr:DNA translocase FtsK 4TM domain-containing protein [bacterium]
MGRSNAVTAKVPRARGKGATGSSATRLREGFGVLLAAAGAYVLVSVFTYHPLDPSFNSSMRGAADVQNAGGIVGSYLADLLVQVLGLSAYVVAGILFATGARLAFGKDLGVRRNQGLASVLALASASILLHTFAGVVAIGGRPAPAGGVVGRIAGNFLLHWISTTGTALFAGALSVLAVMIVTGGSVAAVLNGFVAAFRWCVGFAGAWWKQHQAQLAAERAAHAAEAAAKAKEREKAELAKMAKPMRRTKAEKAAEADDDEALDPLGVNIPPVKVEKKAKKDDARADVDDDKEEDVDEFRPSAIDIVRDGAAEDRAAAGLSDGPKIVAPVAYKPPKPAAKKNDGPKAPTPIEPGTYSLPDLHLLESEDQKPRTIDETALKAQAEVLESKLKDFGVYGRVVEVHPGPVITMFEFEPSAGTKVNRIANLVDDLKMAMKATSVRIVAPIPGKGTVGIEIPNEGRETVFLKDILCNAEYTEKQTLTPIALGKDIGGRPVVADMTKMPHLLVAGTTGSGKSVSVNAMIMSILYRATPSDVRLILVDPKMLEFSIYDGIPHLLLPVITNPKKASMALKWAVTEMERRYRLLADVNARNIAAYNKRIPKILEERNKQETSQQPETANDPLDGAPSAEAIAEAKQKPLEHGHLPYIVIVIDELADLMLVAKNEVEESITRLAQMARAAGIHLLIATQRPSVDVITGLIKANFPSRIAFRVFSKIDSRTVLDAGGAETLLGDGDMLFLPPGTAKLTRVHGAFVSDTEITRVVDFLKAQGKPRYEEEILRMPAGDGEGGGAGGEGEEHDELYDQAIAIVAETRQASISFIQRKLKVGYNRAARMIERMEQEGIVGASDGVKPRPVLIQAIPPG